MELEKKKKGKGKKRRNGRREKNEGTIALSSFLSFKIFINSRVNDAGFIIILIESCYSRTRLT